MKKFLLALLATTLATPALAAQQPVTQLSSVTASREALRTAINTQLSAVQANFDELYTAVGTRPWVIQATAPADTTMAWFDTNQVVDAVVLKIYNGERWVPQAIGEGGSYTLPTAAADTLGGVKVGDRLSIADGVLSADVQTPDISGKEDSLGNPSTNGYVLASTTAGVRSWIEMTGGGAGIAHAPSDGNYYASKDEAWATLAGVFQPADADLTSAAGGSAAGNSKLFGTNSSGVVGWYDIPGEGSGIAHATADGKWYGSKDGAWVDLAPTFSSAVPKWIDLPVGHSFTAGDLAWYNGQVWKASGTHFKVLGEYPGEASEDWEDYIQAPIVVDYPTEVGVPSWTVEGWEETSYTVGTAANNLVQLNASAQLPAVSADLLTITDTSTYFTTDTVGAALNQLGSELAAVTEITLDANTLAITDGVLSVIGGGTGTGGYLATPPTYSDEACTPGQYALSESYRWDCVATGNWNRTALTDWSNPAPVPPTLTSATVGTAGLYSDLLFSETVEIGSGGNGGWSMNCATTGAISMTYSSGDTTNTLAYSLSDTPIQGETCTVAYTQPTDGIEAVDDGTDLATIPSAVVTNNSTVQPEGITCTGSETFIRGASASGDTESFEMGVGDTCASDWIIALDTGMSTYSSGAANSGTYSLLIADDNTISAGYITADHGTAQTEQYYRFYVKVSSGSSFETYANVRLGGPVKYMDAPSAFAVRVRKPSTSKIVIDLSEAESVEIAADEWYRVELKATDADSSATEKFVQEMRVYNSAGTLLETSTGGGDTTVNSTTNVDQFRYFTLAPLASSAIVPVIYIDDVKNCNTWCGAE